MTRMREQLLDVDITIQRKDIVLAGGFENQMDDILRRSRDKAVARAEEVGGTVRPTINPEIVVNEAISPILGEVFLVGTRWVCDVPEGALTSAER